MLKNKSGMKTELMSLLKESEESMRPKLIYFSKEFIKTETGKELDEVINDLKEKHSKLKEKFIKTKPLQLSKDPDKLIDFLIALLNHYRDLYLFPDTEVKSQFKAWGLPLPKLRWMIPLHDILDEIDKIQNEKFIVNPWQVFGLSLIHLREKIASEIFQWGQATIGNSKLDIKKSFHLFIRRLDYGSEKLQKQNQGDFILRQLLKESINLNPNIDARKMYLKGFYGNKEYMLREILSCNFQIQEISQRQYLLSMYDFFKLICKDKNLLTEKEFSILCREKVNQKLDPPFDGDFDTYRYQKLKRLIPSR
jgi:hypothetical protein